MLKALFNAITQKVRDYIIENYKSQAQRSKTPLKEYYLFMAFSVPEMYYARLYKSHYPEIAKFNQYLIYTLEKDANSENKEKIKYEIKQLEATKRQYERELREAENNLTNILSRCKKIFGDDYGEIESKFEDFNNQFNDLRERIYEIESELKDLDLDELQDVKRKKEIQDEILKERKQLYECVQRIKNFFQSLRNN